MQDKRTPPLPTPLFEVTETGSEWIIPLAGNQSTMTITKAVKDEIGRPYRPGSGRLTIHPPHHGIDVVAFGHWELSTRPVLNDREKQAGWVLVVTVENPYDHTRHSMDFGYQPR
ncbi:MAG: hypothetical protein P4M15_12435, partial [Alphaproteobacteria bacterium]|nr:hypothetical protein [Alphaproteobacteria bacterium]